MELRWTRLIIVAAIVGIACSATQLLGDGSNTAVPNSTPRASSATSEPYASEITLGDMQALIQKQGGQPCNDNDELTCITIQVPVDHFDAANTRTLDVVFGIHPATGQRKGMYVQAFPGGPGGKGIATSALSLIEDPVKENFDIVYFDQRGLGLSSPLECQTALVKFFGDLSEDDTDGEEGLDTPDEQQKAIDEARTFAADCTAEIGIPSDELKFYATEQVAEDLESFRAMVGDSQFYLYGVSYGTDVAQTYAAAHPDRLAGLILDGTLDMTLDTATIEHMQEQGFERALLATFEECRNESSCMDDFGGDNPLQVYDDLAAQLADKPIEYDYPLPDGTTVTHLFTFGKLEGVSSFSMYSQAGRMIYLRSLAAAHRGDFVPLARMVYALFYYDPETEDYVGDPNFSYVAYYLVNCADDAYFSGTPEEKVASIIEDGQASNGITPRLDGNIYTGLACAFWPSQPDSSQPAQPLTLEGVPTLVLNAKLDPATPFEWGEAVYKRLDQGYMLYVEGGPHSIAGSEEDCPDNYITDFLVSGTLPDEREVDCQWSSPVMWSYIPPVAADASQFDNLQAGILYTYLDIYLLPEHVFNSRKEEEISAACPYGGGIAFTVGKDKKETLTFAGCAFSKGFELTGTGEIDLETGYSLYEWDIAGQKTGHLTVIFDPDTGGFSIKGDYGGETIDF